VPRCKVPPAAASTAQGVGPRGRPRQRLRRRQRVERGPTPVTKVALGPGVRIPSLFSSVLGLAAGWSRPEYSGAGRDCGTGALGGLARPSPRPERLPRRLWSKRERKGGWRTALPPRGEPGTNEAASFPEGLRRPIFRVPVVCKVIDPAASKLITQSAEHECGFLLNYRCALWTAFDARLTGSEAGGQYDFAT
jgi:hypothetical protein